MQIGDLYNPWKMFTGVFIPDAIVRLTEIGPGPKLLFGRLCWHAGKDGVCFPNQATLAEEIGCTDRSIRTHLEELETFGLITRSRDGKPGSAPFSYAFVWHNCLENSLRKKPESETSSDSFDSEKFSGLIRKSFPVDSEKFSETHIGVREAVREVNSREVELLPPTPIEQQHSEQPEPEHSSQVAIPDDEITIDNISEKLHTRLCEMKTGATKANTKSRARIERAYAVIGATKIFERFEVYLAQGGKSLDDFAKSFSAVQKQRERGGFGSRTPQAEFPSASRQSASSDRPAIRPSAFVAPAEVGDWNHQIPELACAAWDRNYQGLWDRAVSEKMLDFWPKILENAKAAQAGKHERGGFLSLDWVLRNWAKTANGGLSWMTAAVDDAATVSKATSTPRYGLAEAMAEARRQGIISSPSAS